MESEQWSNQMLLYKLYNHMAGNMKQRIKIKNNKYTRKSLEAKNAPEMAIVYKRRTCNPTPLVHQDMTKKTTFYEK